MGTYNLPRNVKGEGRILFIFSKKALLYTVIGTAIGIPFYMLFNFLKISIIGIVIMGILGLVGFLIGTFKMPNSSAFEITKKTGGEDIDDVIKRAIKFQMQKNKIYIYTKDDKVEEDKGETEDE